MKLSDLIKAEGLFQRRVELIRAHRVALSGHGLGITINGQYQDETMISAVKVAVAAEFTRRIADVDAELAALGVEVGA